MPQGHERTVLCRGLSVFVQSAGRRFRLGVPQNAAPGFHAGRRPTPAADPAGGIAPTARKI